MQHCVAVNFSTPPFASSFQTSSIYNAISTSSKFFAGGIRASNSIGEQLWKSAFKNINFIIALRRCMLDLSKGSRLISELRNQYITWVSTWNISCERATFFWSAKLKSIFLLISISFFAALEASTWICFIRQV